MAPHSPQRRRQATLRSRLINTALISTVPLLLLGVVLLAGWYISRRNTLLASNLELARLASAYVDGWVDGQIRTLRTLASSNEVQRGSFTDIQGLVARQLRAQPEWDNLIVTDARGQMIAGRYQPFVSIGDRPFFQQARQTGRPAVSNSLVGQITGHRIVVIAYPITRDGRFVGVVAASVRPQEIQRLFTRIADRPDIILALWGNDWRLIARTRTPERLLGRKYPGCRDFPWIFSAHEGTFIGRSPVSGRMALVGYVSVPNTPWVVVAATPQAVAFSPLYWVTALFGLLSLAVFSVSLWWALRAANLLAAQVRALADSARAIGEGRREMRVALHAGGELDELADSLNKMAADLTVVDRLKADLLALVSHELKTPLTAIRTSLDLLKTGAVPPDSPRYNEVVRIAERQARRLSDLIDNLINVARQEAGSLAVAMRPLPLAPLVTTAIQFHRATAEERGLALIAEVPKGLTVLADSPRITLVLNNLLDNAIKYTEHGSVTVRAVREDGCAVITVTDTGQGFTPAVKVHLFEKFYQPEPLLTRQVGGAGLGLAVVKAIVEAHGGRVFADSPGPDQGSTLGFTLPLAE